MTPNQNCSIGFDGSASGIAQSSVCTRKLGIGEILLSWTFVARHVLLLGSLDWTNIGISFIFLTVKL